VGYFLSIVISYFAVGAYQIYSDHREPFSNQPAYVRGHNRLAGLWIMFFGWLPFKVFEAKSVNRWAELSSRMSLFVVLALLLAWLSS